MNEKVIRDLTLLMGAGAVLIADVIGSTSTVIRLLAALIAGFVAVSRLDHIDAIEKKIQEEEKKDG